MVHGQNLRIDPERLWDSLMEMAKIGPGVAGGNNRQTLTDEDAEGRTLFNNGGFLIDQRFERARQPIAGSRCTMKNFGGEEFAFTRHLL